MKGARNGGSLTAGLEGRLNFILIGSDIVRFLFGKVLECSGYKKWNVFGGFFFIFRRQSESCRGYIAVPLFFFFFYFEYLMSLKKAMQQMKGKDLEKTNILKTVLIPQ